MNKKERENSCPDCKGKGNLILNQTRGNFTLASFWCTNCEQSYFRIIDNKEE